MSAGWGFHRWLLIAIVLMAGGAARAGISRTRVIALNESDPYSFYIYGRGYLDVGTDSVQVNSNAAAAAAFQGSHITLIAGAVNVVGSYLEQGNPPLSTQINVSRPYMADPLGNLPAPDWGDPVGPPKITGSGTFYPGYYPQGLELSVGNHVTLMPGVYVLDNGFELNGAATLHGEGVMFYIRSGAVQGSGTGSVFLAPPDEGPYRGITFFQAHDNANPALFSGLTSYAGIGDAAGIGTLYFPAATVEMGGSGDIDVSGIIADKVLVYGDGVKRVIVPEPSIASLMVVACAGLMSRRRRGRHACGYPPSIRR